ncbi:hypothetical protein [Dyella mobilis]|uniref:Uncharacterized protein n=1 Tax=Dyella mobilis TaxID=1849582 RepID=A0ABS2KK82_9GAMM|nr:hypothetical protein [Dyella mobilis]MBM7131489.1 hypothetical protein [Dyella mobilis]GLQ96539.1 hypothetical protein GCM10007863_09570 [Dyella mobilis]
MIALHRGRATKHGSLRGFPLAAYLNEMASFLIALVALYAKLIATINFCAGGCRLHDGTGTKKQRGQGGRGKDLHEKIPSLVVYYHWRFLVKNE